MVEQVLAMSGCLLIMAVAVLRFQQKEHEHQVTMRRLSVGPSSGEDMETLKQSVKDLQSSVSALNLRSGFKK